MTLPAGYKLEPLPNGVAEGSDTAAALLGFWALNGAIEGEAAIGRLPHVVCLLRDADGHVAASSGALAQAMPEVGGRRFWLLRCLTPSGHAREALESILLCAWDVLAARTEAEGPPLGVCFALVDPELIATRDEAIWPESKMLFAGWTTAGEQLRVRYFEGAKIL